MSNLASNFYIFGALIKRDLKVLKSRLLSVFIDNCAILAVVLILFGYLLPKMGMPEALIGPIFIGNTVMSFFEIGFSLSTKLVHDIKFNRFIDYQVGLPTSLPWIIGSYIVNFIIETSLVSLPTLALGIFLLGDKFVIIQLNIPGFIFMYLLSLIFFATLFLLFSFAYEYHWFWSNIWTRRLEPLFAFGAIFVVWKKVYAFSQFWGILFLFNPITYTVEGLRSALIGGDTFIPLPICLTVVSFAILLNLFLLLPTIKKRLDYV